MRHYHCPHCSILIQHRPQYAGERVVCSKCKGAYFEPTDPLPGVKPEKAPPVEDPGQIESAAARAGTVESASSPAAATKGAASGITQIEPSDMVAELARRGQNAVLLFWDPDSPSDAGLAFSKNLSRQAADDQLIQVAVHVMQSRWPDLHQLILNRLSGP